MFAIARLSKRKAPYENGSVDRTVCTCYYTPNKRDEDVEGPSGKDERITTLYE